MRFVNESNHTSKHPSGRVTTNRSATECLSPSEGLDDELGTLFRQTCERTAPLLRERLRTPMKFINNNGVKCDTADDSLLGTHFSAFEAAAAYLTRGGEFYIRVVSPINDGTITFEKSEIAAISSLLAYWFFRPFPTFPDLVAFAGEHSPDHAFEQVVWLSLDDYAKQWPEWLKALVNNSERREPGDPRTRHDDRALRIARFVTRRGEVMTSKEGSAIKSIERITSSAGENHDSVAHSLRLMPANEVFVSIQIYRERASVFSL